MQQNLLQTCNSDVVTKWNSERSSDAYGGISNAYCLSTVVDHECSFSNVLAKNQRRIIHCSMKPSSILEIHNQVALRLLYNRKPSVAHS